ncbi:MAG TPA: ABC transporter ATP-binding protein [Thermoanaerobaculia bacterium]|nr:ABC transporter ATP-binding protein [Thermoanaerobaculia bacterium]
MSRLIIEVFDLVKDYGEVRALRGLRLGIERGGIVGLLGPNGAGKTTLVEILEGLRTPTSGRVSVLGFDPTREPRALRERLGVQLQSTALPPELSPIETLSLFAAFFGRSLPPRGVLEQVGLADKARSRNRSLSGGQQRRLAIGIALVSDPELVILDEPTSGLDPLARREVHARIRDLREAGRTVLLTTHQIDEAEALCDRVILLKDGVVVADGTPFELVSRAGGSSILWIAVEGELAFAPLLAVGAVAQGREGAYHRFSTPDPTAAILALGELLREQKTTLVDLRMKRPDLEDVYLDLMEERR